jgi:hypothetical protein
MFNPFQRDRPHCPVCRHIFQAAGGHGPLRCALCDSQVYIPVAYARWVWFAVLVLLCVVGIFTHNAQHSGIWILLLLLSAVPLRILLGILIPPWFEAKKDRVGFPFLLWYICLAITMPLSWTAIGWFQVLTGSSKSEIQETLITLSLPLGWISPEFLLNTSKDFFDVCGVVLGNSFFYALATFAVWRAAHSVIRRNRVTAMNIEGRSGDDDDDEIL